MALVINTNIASLSAQNHLAANRKEMETAMERLSSGLRVNSAADDAAGHAIATRMDAQIRGMTKAVQNANDGISLAQTAAGAQKEITEMLQRMRELAVQSSNSSNNDTDRATLQAEVAELVAEIDQIAVDTRFNNQVLLDGKYSANIQTGFLATQDLDFSIDSMKSADLGLSSGNAASSLGITTYVTDRTTLAPSHGAIEAGDILINGQAMAAIAATDEISDVVDNINLNVDGVTASAFNTVIMKDVGTGVATKNQIMISVQNVGSGAASTDVQYQAFMIDEDASSLAELAALINIKTEGRVTATVNSDGKLQLDNSTGAGISVKDLTTNAVATGLGSGANIDESQAAASNAYSPATATTTVDTRIFNGMLKLETTDGSPITIEKGPGQASGGIGTQTELDILGMNQVNVNDGTFTTYSIQGDQIAAASTNATLASVTQSALTTAFTAGDVIVNGVDVFNRDIDTSTFLGKLASINSVSDQTGVTATAAFEQFFDVSSLAGATGRITFTGADGTTTASGALSTTLATTVTNINTAVSTIDSTLTATVDGTGSLKIAGDVRELTFTLNAAASGVALMETIFGTDDTDFTTYYAGIQLEAEGSTAITVDLGDDIPSHQFGLKAANVGASDFDENDTSISDSTTISGLSIATQSQASAAIASIDAAIQQVTDSSADLGAVENRLNHVIANVSETIVNTEAAKSRIVDADFAVESARLAKQQILQQAASAMLAQANAAPQSVLSLLGG